MAEKIKLKKTGAGAQQYMRGIDNKDPDKFSKIDKQVTKIRNLLEKDLRKLGVKGFKEKHGISYLAASRKVSAMDNAETARVFKELHGKNDITAKMYDKFEKKDIEDSKKFIEEDKGKAKGGVINRRMGAQDYRKGGLTLNTVDNRKKK